MRFSPENGARVNIIAKLNSAFADETKKPTYYYETDTRTSLRSESKSKSISKFCSVLREYIAHKTITPFPPHKVHRSPQISRLPDGLITKMYRVGFFVKSFIFENVFLVENARILYVNNASLLANNSPFVTVDRDRLTVTITLSIGVTTWKYFLRTRLLSALRYDRFRKKSKSTFSRYALACGSGET